MRGATFLVHTVTLVLAEVWLFARPALQFLYGPAYLEAVGATKVLLLAESLGTLSVLAFSCLIATGRHRRYPIITLAGLGLNIALNLVLIPRYSYRGAAVATLCTEALVFGLMWWQLLSTPGVRPLRLAFLLRGLPAVVAAIGVASVAREVLPWPVAATLLFVVYLVGAQVLRSPGPAGWRSLLSETAPRPKRRAVQRRWP